MKLIIEIPADPKHEGTVPCTVEADEDDPFVAIWCESVDDPDTERGIEFSWDEAHDLIAALQHAVQIMKPIP